MEAVVLIAVFILLWICISFPMSHSYNKIDASRKNTLVSSRISGYNIFHEPSLTYSYLTEYAK